MKFALLSQLLKWVTRIYCPGEMLVNLEKYTSELSPDGPGS